MVTQWRSHITERREHRCEEEHLSSPGVGDDDLGPSSVVLAQLGVVICVGVLLDTLLVRTVLVPAIALILGDRFWWPRRMGPTANGAAPHVEPPALVGAGE